MPISFDSALGIHDKALLVRARRGEILASNLANADTPGYKARDIDFREALARASGNSHGGLALKVTNERHIRGFAPGPEPELRYRVPLQPSLDGNTVDTQLEKAAFAENALQYQTTLQFLSSKFRGLKLAIRGE